jgi:hypothetical protein
MNAFFSFDLFMGCSFITVSESCNNQRPRCDIARLHVTKSFKIVVYILQIPSYRADYEEVCLYQKS